MKGLLYIVTGFEQGKMERVDKEISSKGKSFMDETDQLEVKRVAKVTGILNK